MHKKGGKLKNSNFQFAVFSRNRQLAATTLKTKN
jgi:hypothetical protein